MKTYTDWPSKEAFYTNRKVFGGQRASIERLSPSPTRPQNDPIADEVELNRVVERAQSSMRATRGQGTDEFADPVASIERRKYAYMKRGAGMGQNFMRRAPTTAGAFTRQDRIVKHLKQADRREDLANIQKVLHRNTYLRQNLEAAALIKADRSNKIPRKADCDK